MADKPPAELRPTRLPDLGPLPSGPVFEWLAERGMRAEQQVLERRRRMAIVIEQTQWLDSLLREIESELHHEIVRAGGQRFGHICLHDRESKLGRLYSLTPLTRSAGVLRRWFLTYTVHIPDRPQRTLPLVVDLLFGGRTLQLKIAAPETLAVSGTVLAEARLRRLHQFALEGVGSGCPPAIVAEANRTLRGELLTRVREAIATFQAELLEPTSKVDRLDEWGPAAGGRQFLDPRQVVP